MAKDMNVEHAVREGALDELISGTYRIVTEECAWEDWLSMLLVETQAASAELLIGERRYVAHANSRRPRGFASECIEISCETGKNTSLLLRNSAGNAALLEHLKPHLQRVVQLLEKFEDGLARIQQMAAALAEGLSVGMFVINARDARVVHSNALAHEIIAGSHDIRLRNGRLEIAGTVGKRSAQDAIRALQRGTARIGQHVVVDDGDRRLALLFNRLDRCTGNFVDGDASRYVVVFITQPSELPALRSDHLLREYGLSPKESRLAVGLAQGYSLEELSGMYHVSRHTLRAQLKSVLKKTSVRSQAALVKLLLDDPRMLFSGEPH